MDIVVNVNHLYVEAFMVTLHSLKVSNGNYDLRIHIIDCGLDDLDYVRINEFAASIGINNPIHFIKGSDLVGSFHPNADVSMPYYVRLFAHNMPEDRVIILDCDGIVVSELNSLWNMDLDGGGYLLAACYSTRQPFTRKLLGIPPDHECYNIGLAVLNLKLMREMNWSELVQDYVSGFKGRIPTFDESIFCAVAKDKIKALDLKYNVMDEVFRFSPKQMKKLTLPMGRYSDKTFNEAREHPVFIHFAGMHKPWGSYCSHPFLDLYIKMAAEVGVTLSELRESVRKWESTHRNIIVKDKIRKSMPFFLTYSLYKLNNIYGSLKNYIQNNGYSRNWRKGNYPHL